MTSGTDRIRRLVLLRHAKTEPGSSGPDALRALTEEGRRQAAWVGGALRDAQLEPELALVSAAVRTQQTWQHVAEAFDPEPEQDQRDELYSGGVGTVLDAVRALDERVRTVLVVGHEPVMSRTAALLADEGSEPALRDRVTFGVPTATFAVLEVTGAWETLDPGGARLVDVVVAPR